MEEKRIVIVGGGFAGIRAALDLAKKKIPDTKIILISNKHHFEYYPTLYRVVTGRSPLEVCIPLEEIFKNKNVEIVLDEILSIDSDAHTIQGKSESTYKYTYLILALGSETVYFNLPGLDKLAFGFKSINEALRLKRHLHEMFDSHHAEISQEDLVSNLHILMVGGGASGVELTGDLLAYMKHLSKKHGLSESLVTIDIIEAAPRLLPALPEYVSEKVMVRLRRLGANIFLNRALVKEDLEQVYLKDMTLKSQTVIWTAGMKPNHLYKNIPGITMNKNGRVTVTENLEAKGLTDVFVLGDAADTKYAGLAQTALRDGKYIAKLIASKIKGLNGREVGFYIPKKVSYAVPVGPGWAAVLIGPVTVYGEFAAWIRKLIDLRFFLTILSFNNAFRAWKSNKKLCESCETCNEN